MTRYQVGDLTFEWDDQKAADTLQKHGVGFPEAATVFGDFFALTVYDTAHSGTEDRYLTLGRSDRQRLLTTAYTQRRNHIRLITARRATATEIKQYEQQFTRPA